LLSAHAYHTPTPNPNPTPIYHTLRFQNRTTALPTEYLVNTFREERRLFDQSVYELGIGVFGTVVTMPQTSRLIDVLEVMERR
jgi:hypothetical protein